MKESLISLAESKSLPFHQYMDFETLLWIKENKPDFKYKKIIKFKNKSIIKNFIPQKNWFYKKKEYDSIHGIRHLLRVGIFASNLFYLKKSENKIENIVISSVLHDIRRMNDKDDFEHGMRSAEWFKKNYSIVKKKFKVQLKDSDIEEIYWSMALHDVDYKSLKNKKIYLRFKNIINFIKIADALDRYRLPKKKWWIDKERLEIKVEIPSVLENFAFDLIVCSEELFLESGASIQSVINTYERI